MKNTNMTINIFHFSVMFHHVQNHYRYPNFNKLYKFLVPKKWGGGGKLIREGGLIEDLRWLFLYIFVEYLNYISNRIVIVFNELVKPLD